MSPDAAADHEAPPVAHAHVGAHVGAQVTAALNFIVPDGDKPRVLMADDYTEENRRSGTFRDTPMTIRNGRLAEPAPALDREGFELCRHTSDVSNFYDEDQITVGHYPEIIRFLMAVTGATDVHIFDHTLRVQDDTKRQAHDTRGPVHVVHNDYTEKSGPQRITDLLAPDRAAKFLAGRFALVNVWRSIGHDVQRLPLAIADARTMTEDDFVATDMVYADRLGEIYQIAGGPNQRWSYFPNMTHDEVVLLKCFDSARDGRARYTAHGAFDDPSVPADTPPRESLEIRTLLSFA